METVEIYTAIREIVITILGLVLVAGLTVLKNTIQNRFKTAEEREQYKKLEDLARMVVIATEKKYKEIQATGEGIPTGDGQMNRSPEKWGPVKREFAMTFLRDKFPDLDVETIGLYIDAAADMFTDGQDILRGDNLQLTSRNNVTYRGQEVNK